MAADGRRFHARDGVSGQNGSAAAEAEVFGPAAAVKKQLNCDRDVEKERL